MSERKWKIDSRVPHHHRGERRNRGSGFPRLGMRTFEGERMSMRKRQFSKHKVISVGYYHWTGDLHHKYINGLLKKYLNKPYDNMLSEFYAKTKSLRQSRKLRLWQGEDCVLKEIEVGSSPKLNWWVTRPKKYYVDEEGFIRLKKKQNSASSNKKLTKKQWFFNHQTPVPTFNTDDFLQLKRIYETPDLFVGNFFAVVDGKVRKVPIFTSPKIENGSQKPERKAVSGYNFEVVFNDVFWSYTYEEANDYKAYYRKVIEKLESEDKPENAELIARLKRTLFTVKDYRIVHGRMKLDFYTKNVKK